MNAWRDLRKGEDDEAAIRGALSAVKTRRRLGADALECAHMYKGAWYRVLNRMDPKERKERKGVPEPLARLDATLARLASTHRWRWQRDDRFLLFRSLSGGYAKRIGRLSVGDEFVNAGYTSTSFALRHALGFGGEASQTLLVIRVRNRTPYFYIDGLRDAYLEGRPSSEKEGAPGRWVDQDEVIFPRGARFRVHAVEERDRVYRATGARTIVRVVHVSLSA